MAEYSPTQLEENLDREVVPQAAPKSWRRFGMVVAALGTAGAIFGVTRPKSLTTLQKMQQVVHAGHSFIQAVVARALQDDDNVHLKMGMIFAPVELEKFEGVSAAVFLRPSEDGTEDQFTVKFQAHKEQGQALADQFQTILDGVLENCDEEQGCPKEMFEHVDVSHDEETDKVSIKLTPPVPDMGPDEEEFEKGMAEKPTLEMMIHTGRDFEAMVENMHGCPDTIEGGVNFTASTKIAQALLEVMRDQMGGMWATEMKQALKTFSSLSSVSSHTEVRYHTEKFEASVCNAEESDEQKQMIEDMKVALPQELVPIIGEEAVKAAGELKDYADHLDSVLLTGMENNYEIYMEFENFHLTPVIAEFMQLPETE